MVDRLALTDLTNDKSETIGFVIACVFSSAIDLVELRLWAALTIEKMPVEEIPEYLFELTEFDGPLFKISSVIGFSPVWERSEEEECALYGIAIKRKKNSFDMPYPLDKAVKCLDNSPQIAEMFAKVFPFIDL